VLDVTVKVGLSVVLHLCDDFGKDFNRRKDLASDDHVGFASLGNNVMRERLCNELYFLVVKFATDESFDAGFSLRNMGLIKFTKKALLSFGESKRESKSVTLLVRDDFDSFTFFIENSDSRVTIA